MRLSRIALLFLSVTALAQPKVIPVAMIIEKPGSSLDSPPYISQCLKAAELAVEERKKEFIAKGFAPVLQTYFTNGERTASYKKLEEAMAGSAVAAVGLPSSDEAAVASSLLKGSEFLAVSPFATATSLLNLKPNLLLYAASNAEIASALERYVDKSLKPKKLATVVAWDSAYSKDFYLSLSEEFRKRMQLVKIQEKVKDIDVIVKNTLAYGPDVILLPNFPVSTGALIKAFQEAGYRGRFVGPDSWGEGVDKRLSLIVGNLELEAYQVRQFSRFRLPTSAGPLKEKLAKLDDQPFATLSGLYYDSTNYVLDLIKETLPNPTRKTVFEASKLHSRHHGTMGTNCLSAATCPDREFMVIRLNRGSFEYSGKI